MNNELLVESLKNLLNEFMLQKDLESERKFFDESGLTVDEEGVMKLHEKKMELLRAVEEAKKDKKKLSETDMADVSGGNENMPLSVKMAIAGLARMFVSYFYSGDSLDDTMYEGVKSALVTVVGSLAGSIINLAWPIIEERFFYNPSLEN